MGHPEEGSEEDLIQSLRGKVPMPFRPQVTIYNQRTQGSLGPAFLEEISQTTKQTKQDTKKRHWAF